MRVELARERIREHADVHAFISLTDEVGSGPVVAIKDAIDVRGCRTTAGALPHLDNPTSGERVGDGVAVNDAPVVERLRKSGCVVVGKTNLHEFCLGPTSENPHFGSVRNPVDHSRIAGGSSGGSAAAVALGMCDWALGTDTSGSVRIPAALCGVVGVKVTTGRVDTAGTVPLSRTQDTIGPLARDVGTAAGAMELVTGDRMVPQGPPIPWARWRVAVPAGWCDDLETDVAAVWTAVSEGLPQLQVPDADALRATGSTIVMAEAASLHRRRFRSAPELYGQDVRELLAQAMKVPRAAYVGALYEAARLRLLLEEALVGWDALMLPATRTTATALGQEVERGSLTDLTRPFSTTGHPVVCLPAPSPCLPVGVQLVGRHGAEAHLLEVATALESHWR